MSWKFPNMGEKGPRHEDKSKEAILAESAEGTKTSESPEIPPEKTEAPAKELGDAHHIEDIDAATFEYAILSWELERNRVEAIRAEAREMVERIKHLTKQELEKLLSNIERFLSSGKTIAEDEAVTIALLHLAAREILKTK